MFAKVTIRTESRLHRDLIDAYRSNCPGGWSSGPDDGYFFQHLPYHLSEAGLGDELRGLLLDLDWLEAKLRATDVVQLLADFDLARGTRPSPWCGMRRG